MYKALIEIGGYNPGMIVPNEIAEVWEKMYVKSPVEKIEDKPVEEVKKEEQIIEVEVEEKEESGDLMTDDYLNRGKDVVLNNLKKDNFSKEQLKKLIDCEKKNKNRKQIINALEKNIT
jgi:hypothetical protein